LFDITKSVVMGAISKIVTYKQECEISLKPSSFYLFIWVKDDCHVICRRLKESWVNISTKSPKWMPCLFVAITNFNVVCRTRHMIFYYEVLECQSDHVFSWSRDSPCAMNVSYIRSRIIGRWYEPRACWYILVEN
jgi:hypothetical protein